MTIIKKKEIGVLVSVLCKDHGTGVMRFNKLHFKCGRGDTSLMERIKKTKKKTFRFRSLERPNKGSSFNPLHAEKNFII